jgi:hypothetical protein
VKTLPQSLNFRVLRSGQQLKKILRWFLSQSQLPAVARFRTKTALAVEMLRQADAASIAPLLRS